MKNIIVTIEFDEDYKTIDKAKVSLELPNNYHLQHIEENMDVINRIVNEILFKSLKLQEVKYVE